ncbi:hypothetical protein Ancab_035466 [Ancistrocladus abbreviatus]
MLETTERENEVEDNNDGKWKRCGKLPVQAAERGRSWCLTATVDFQAKTSESTSKTTNRRGKTQNTGSSRVHFKGLSDSSGCYLEGTTSVDAGSGGFNQKASLVVPRTGMRDDELAHMEHEHIVVSRSTIVVFVNGCE